MKLFKIELDNVGYDDYDSCVIVAENKEQVEEFGNDLKSYAYGKEIEPYKKALHYLIVFQNESLMKKMTDILIIVK